MPPHFPKPTALCTALSIVACAPQVQDPSEDDDTDAESDDGESDENDVDEAPPADGGGGPQLPHPRAFGLDLSRGSTLEPESLIVEAERVHAIDPGITSIELTRDLDVVDGSRRAYHTSFTIRGFGPDCGATGRVLLEQDTRHPGEGVRPDAEMLAAIVADLIEHRPSSTCGDDSKDGTHDAGPFGNNFWGARACADAQDAEFASGTALQVAIPGILATGTPAWAAACAGHAEPAGVTYCESLVAQISGHLISAEIRIEAARLIVDLMDHITSEAMQIAAQCNLGFGGLANAIDVAELATMALEVAALKPAADAQASIAVGHLLSARAAASLDPILAATAAPTVLGGLVVSGNVWQVDEAELSECYRRVVAWIAAAAAIGLGFRLFGPGGANLQFHEDPEFDDETVLIVGPRRIQSLLFFFADEIAIHVDQLPPDQQAMTRRVNGAWVSRLVYAGFEKPGFGHVLNADVMVPEPLTLVPIVAAPAGAAIELGGGGYGGPSNEVADTVYEPSNNTVFLGRAGIDLNWQETDKDGKPLNDIWGLCKVLPQDPLDPRYCGLGLQSTVPPWRIGEALHRYWRIWAMGGLVDPTDGAVIEPEGAQFFFSLHATGEGPSSACWVWDQAENDYLYQPWLPGCGPSGGDGGDGPPPPG